VKSAKAVFQRVTSVGAAMVLALLVTGCASGPTAIPSDPLEPWNRGVYKFNDAVDRAVVRPVAVAYRDVVPSPVKTGVSNFFNNLQDAWSFVNHALQFKGEAASNSLVRFGVNSVFGLGGLLDIATEMRIERSTKDFGHTLGYWGVGAGPYLMLPLFGPSTLRDTVALTVDSQGDLLSDVGHVPTRNSATAVKLVNLRASLLKATDMLDQVALDPYAFVRDAHLARRQSAVYDGNPPSDEPSTPIDEKPSAP